MMSQSIKQTPENKRVQANVNKQIRLTPKQMDDIKLKKAIDSIPTKKTRNKKDLKKFFDEEIN